VGQFRCGHKNPPGTMGYGTFLPRALGLTGFVIRGDIRIHGSWMTARERRVDSMFKKKSQNGELEECWLYTNDSQIIWTKQSNDIQNFGTGNGFVPEYQMKFPCGEKERFM
jgi:hypothetical protein